MRTLGVVLWVAMAGTAWAQDEGDEPVAEEPGEPAGAGEAGDDPGAAGEPGGAVLGYVTGPTEVKVDKGEPFEFDGETLEDVVEQIRDKPVGHMECEPFLFLEKNASDDEVAKRCKIEVRCVMRLPEWTNRDKRPAAAQKEWDRYRDLIRKHEEGHKALHKPFYEGICKAAKGKTNGEIRGLVEEGRVKAKAANDEHDRKTNHGKNDAKLDGSKDPKKSNQAGYEGGEAQAEPPAEAPAEAADEPAGEAGE